MLTLDDIRTTRKNGLACAPVRLRDQELFDFDYSDGQLLVAPRGPLWADVLVPTNDIRVWQAWLLDCVQCGQPLVSLCYYRHKPVCSNRCHAARRKERWAPRPSRAKAPEPKACAHCGVTFLPKRRDAKTCGAACRKALSRAR